MKIKILHIIPNLYTGGAEKFCIDLCNELSYISDYSVKLVSLYSINKNMPLRKLISPSVEIITLNKKKGLDFSLFFKIYRLVRNEKPNIINTHLSSLLYSTFIIILSKIKIFHTVHNLAKKETSFFRRKLYKIFFKLFNVKPIAISKIVGESIINEYNIKPIIITNGTVPPQKTSNFEKVKIELNKLKKNTNTKIFLNIGRISFQKNQEDLIKVFSSLESSNKNVILLIIGEDTTDNKELLKKLYYLKGNNTFFLGLKNNIADYLINSDAFILTSKWEGLPITLLEAISLGKLSICTSVGGIPEVIKHGYNGILIDNPNESSIYNAIMYYLSLDKNRIDEIERNAKKTFYENYDMVTVTKKYLKAYFEKI